MTEEQVVAASQGAARPSVPADQPADRSRDAEVKLTAPVSWAGQSFVAYYAFDRQSHRLSSVTLQLQAETDDKIASVRRSLGSTYGSPSNSIKRQDMELLVWILPEEQISFIRLSDPRTAVGAPVTSIGYQGLGVRP